MKKASQSLIKQIIPQREKEAKKYDHGMVIVIGGSNFYSGSPALSALCAFKVGADMVQIIAPKRAADIIASFSPNMAAYPLEGDHLREDHLPTLFSFTRAAEDISKGRVSVVIGGGLGRSEETKRAVLEYIKEVSLPTVIDADAIYALEGQEGFLKENILITPHLYEFYILTGRNIKEVPKEERPQVVLEEAKRLGVNILLKGATDIVSDGKEIGLNELAVPYMTVGGCGDTLAGIAGGLLSRKKDIFLCALTAAFINTKAGSLASKELGESFTATDLIEKIPKVIK